LGSEGDGGAEIICRRHRTNMASFRKQGQDTHRHAQHGTRAVTDKGTRKKVLTKKMRGLLGKKIVQKSRNSWLENSGGVGAYGQLIQGANENKSYNQIQTPQ